MLYTEATLDPTTGQCCSAGNQGGQCTNPRPGVVRETPYGFPDHHPAPIFEGAVQYTHGPPVWSPQTPSGDFGFTMMPAGLGKIAKDSDCPPVPSQLHVNRSGAVPMSFAAHDVGNTPLGGCFLGCDTHEVERTGGRPLRWRVQLHAHRRPSADELLQWRRAIPQARGHGHLRVQLHLPQDRRPDWALLHKHQPSRLPALLQHHRLGLE